MIISNVCKIRPDHYKIDWVEGRFQVNSVVQDYSWDGELVVTRFVAENCDEVVAEGVGRDESGCRIVRFLVVDKCWLDGSEDLILDADGRVSNWTLPRALDKEWYLPRGYQGDNVPFPHYSFPFFESSPFSNSFISDSDATTVPDKLSTHFSFLQYFFCLA